MCICEEPNITLPNSEFKYRDLPGPIVDGKRIKFGEIEHYCGKFHVIDYIPPEERHKYTFKFR
jgi:hypothetical protein